MKRETYTGKYYSERNTFYRTPFTPEAGLARVHEICGCAGKFDCDCVSVVNKAHVALWTEHNAKERP